MFFEAKDGEALYSQPKQDQELTVAQTMNSLLHGGPSARPSRPDDEWPRLNETQDLSLQGLEFLPDSSDLELGFEDGSLEGEDF